MFHSFGKDFAFHNFSFLGDRTTLAAQGLQLQSNLSTVCGQYCKFFILRPASGESCQQIVFLFTESKPSNDTTV